MRIEFSRTPPRRCVATLLLAAFVASPTAHAASRHIPLPVAQASIPGADGDTLELRLSQDGSRELFSSRASNLVPGTIRGRTQLYLREGNTLRRLAHGAFGASPSADVLDIALSGDGEVAVFLSAASNLVPGDSGTSVDLFRLVIDSGTLTRFPLGVGQALGSTDRVTLDTDGSRACLSTRALLDTAADTDNLVDAYLLNFEPPLVKRMSGAPGNANGNRGVVGRCRFATDDAGGDGVVVFASASSNLVAGDSNGETDIFLRSASASAPLRISLGTAGVQTSGGGNSEPWLVSSNGVQTLYWRSCATNVIANDNNAACDIFRRSLVTGDTTRVSRGFSDAELRGDSGDLFISSDGLVAVFHTSATNAGPAIARVRPNALLFARDIDTVPQTIVLHDAEPAERLRPAAFARRAQNEYTLGFLSDAIDIESAGQRTVVLNAITQSVRTTIGGFGSNSPIVRSRATSTAFSTDAPDGDTLAFALSGDGRHLAFYSHASNLVADDNNASADVFLLDLHGVAPLRKLMPADPAFGFRLGSIDTRAPAVSHDGSRVAFVSDGLLPFDNRIGNDIYLWSRDTEPEFQLVSASTATGAAQGRAQSPTMDASGQLIAFVSSASNLVAGSSGTHRQVYVRDMADESFVRLSESFSGPGDGDSFDPTMSADGSLVTFCSRANDLVANDSNPGADLFVADLEAGTLQRIGAGHGDTCSADLSASGETLLLEGVVMDPRTEATPGGFEGEDLGPFPSLDARGRHVAGIQQAESLVIGGVDRLVAFGDRRSLRAQLAPIAPSGTPQAALSGQQGHLDMAPDGASFVLTSREPLDPSAPGLPRVRNLYRHAPVVVFVDSFD